MTNNIELKLSAATPQASIRMLAVVAVGLLHCVEQGELTVDEIHSYAFSPYTLEKLQSTGLDPDLANLFHRAFFLEDLEAHFPAEVLKTRVSELKHRFLKVAKQNQHDPSIENKWMKPT